MQTNYKKLNADQYKVEICGNGSVILHNIDETASFVLSQNDYEMYKNDRLDNLQLENMYYRGLAVDDEGEFLESNGIFLSDEKYFPLLSDEYVSFNINTEKNNYVILLNPEVGSWVAFENDEFELYKSCKLDNLKMENLYFRSLAKDAGHDLIMMDFPEPAERPSVIVVNLTMSCNLRCKYCFAACEPGKG
ncbi:MAG: hypothetical protein IIT39_05340, partial [Clostridia bacterium]|nr:hypothetical protein [Clostridia bacterium]